MCNYHSSPNCKIEYKCNREEYKDGFCIFHCDKEGFTEKETKKFNEEFWKEFKRQEENKNLKRFDFTGFKFPVGFSFEKKEFKKSVNFTEATFNGKAYFSQATFNMKVYFSRATFKSEADFSRTTFNSEADFSQATFNSEAYFLWTTFNSEAHFLEATFNIGAYFSRATFKSETDFSQATFNMKAYFSRATFNSEADFSSANFKGGAYFLSTTFNSEAHFLEATFNIGAYFSRATFKSETDFSQATFNMKAYFSRATFNSEADFSSANFKGGAYFLSTTFNSEAYFFSTTFNSEAYFFSANFKTPEDVEFVNVDLSNVSFLQCKNIDRIGRFEEVGWNKKVIWEIKWNKKSVIWERQVVYDEIKINTKEKNYGYIAEIYRRNTKEKNYEKNTKEKNYGYIAEIYRKLRLNYEKNLRFAEAGDFYIGEMEMRRKNVKGNFEWIKWIKRNFSAIAFYKYFSYYGENYLLPLVWIFIAVVTFSFLLSTDILTSTQIFLQFPPADLNVKVKDLLIPIINFTINSGWFVLSERILGILFIALFVLALRRKFKKTSE